MKKIHERAKVDSWHTFAGVNWYFPRWTVFTAFATFAWWSRCRISRIWVGPCEPDAGEFSNVFEPDGCEPVVELWLAWVDVCRFEAGGACEHIWKYKSWKILSRLSRGSAMTSLFQVRQMSHGRWKQTLRPSIVFFRRAISSWACTLLGSRSLPAACVVCWKVVRWILHSKSEAD